MAQVLVLELLQSIAQAAVRLQPAADKMPEYLTELKEIDSVMWGIVNSQEGED